MTTGDRRSRSQIVFLSNSRDARKKGADASRNCICIVNVELVTGVLVSERVIKDPTRLNRIGQEYRISRRAK